MDDGDDGELGMLVLYREHAFILSLFSLLFSSLLSFLFSSLLFLFLSRLLLWLTS